MTWAAFLRGAARAFDRWAVNLEEIQGGGAQRVPSGRAGVAEDVLALGQERAILEADGRMRVRPRPPHNPGVTLVTCSPELDAWEAEQAEKRVMESSANQYWTQWAEAGLPMPDAPTRASIEKIVGLDWGTAQGGGA